MLKEIILAWVCVMKSFFKNDLPLIFTGGMGKHYFHSINVTLNHMDSLTSKLFFHVELNCRQYVDLPSGAAGIYFCSLPFKGVGLCFAKPPFVYVKKKS